MKTPSARAAHAEAQAGTRSHALLRSARPHAHVLRRALLTRIHKQSSSAQLKAWTRFRRPSTTSSCLGPSRPPPPPPPPPPAPRARAPRASSSSSSSGPAAGGSSALNSCRPPTSSTSPRRSPTTTRSRRWRREVRIAHKRTPEIAHRRNGLAALRWDTQSLGIRSSFRLNPPNEQGCRVAVVEAPVNRAQKLAEPAHKMRVREPPSQSASSRVSHRPVLQRTHSPRDGQAEEHRAPRQHSSTDDLVRSAVRLDAPLRRAR